MPDIAPISTSIGASSASALGSFQRAASDSSRLTPRTDRVELSEHARHLERLRALPQVRAAKVDAVKSAIAKGAYDTPERMKMALQRLLDELTA